MFLSCSTHIYLSIYPSLYPRIKPSNFWGILNCSAQVSAHVHLNSLVCLLLMRVQYFLQFFFWWKIYMQWNVCVCVINMYLKYHHHMRSLTFVSSETIPIPHPRGNHCFSSQNSFCISGISYEFNYLVVFRFIHVSEVWSFLMLSTIQQCE